MEVAYVGASFANLDSADHAEMRIECPRMRTVAHRSGSLYWFSVLMLCIGSLIQNVILGAERGPVQTVQSAYGGGGRAGRGGPQLAELPQRALSEVRGG